MILNIHGYRTINKFRSKQQARAVESGDVRVIEKNEQKN
jgi:hypothetical protein